VASVTSESETQVNCLNVRIRCTIRRAEWLIIATYVYEGYNVLLSSSAAFHFCTSVALFSLSFEALGWGRTHSNTPWCHSLMELVFCGPSVALGSIKASRKAVIPTTATARGLNSITR